MNRTYHNLTARDNGYFNARELVRATKAKLEVAHKDNYDAILPVLKLATPEASKSSSPQMDEVIKKASIVIQRHEISKWIDNSYLLIGKAYFYKRDYFTAIETFQFVYGKFKNPQEKTEALISMAQSYLEIGKNSEAQGVLDLANSSISLTKGLSYLLHSTYAQFFINTQNYPKAIEELEIALKSKPHKQERIRCLYILAQLYSLIGNSTSAGEYFTKVIKAKSPYEMEFNARISNSRLYEVNNNKDKNSIENDLIKMSKDDKNKEYLDQIYFALGDIALKQKDYQKAVKYFELSAKSSLNNPAQKGQSFLKLAETYFYMLADYPKAEAYYDSTVVLLPPSTPGFNEISIIQNNLKTLVKDLTIISREDSLQKLSKFQIEDLTAFIDKKVEEELKARETREQDSKNKNVNATTNKPPSTNTTVSSTSGGWYFNNATAISTGYTSFIKKWGKRPLEDNWRQSNNATSNRQPDAEDAGPTLSNPTQDKGQEIKALRQEFLSNIPLSPEKLEVSNNKLIEAYYELGNLYKETLLNYSQAIKTFELLLDRFPENKYKLETLYSLYRTNLQKSDYPRADYYKNILLGQYPESIFAKIINDPEYAKQALANNNKVDSYYETTYAEFERGNYAEVMNRKLQSESLFPANQMSAQFDYLNALAIGKTQGLAAYVASLTSITQKYPASNPVKLKAEETLKLLAKANEAPMVVKDSSIYSLNIDNADHFLIIEVNNININIESTKIAISDFNKKYYDLFALSIATLVMNGSSQLIKIDNFINKKKALEYYKSFMDSSNDIVKMSPDKYAVFMISAENYYKLVAQKSTAPYIDFFNKNYLNNEQ